MNLSGHTAISSIINMSFSGHTAFWGSHDVFFSGHTAVFVVEEFYVQCDVAVCRHDMTFCQQHSFLSQQQHRSIICLGQKWCSERFARFCETKWSEFFCQNPFAPGHPWVRLHEPHLLSDHTKAFYWGETSNDQKRLPHITIFEHQNVVGTQGAAIAVCTFTKLQARFLFFQWL